MEQTSERRRLSGAERRDQILDITHAIVDAEGFYAATPNRIAREAGVTRPVLYQQFGDMGGLYVALVDRERDRAAEQFAEIAADSDAAGVENPLASTFEGILRAIDARPATWRLFLTPPEGAPRELHQRLEEAAENVRNYLETQLRVMFPDLRDPEYVARLLHAGGRELLRLRVTDPASATDDRLEALMRDVAEVALAPRASRAVQA